MFQGEIVLKRTFNKILYCNPHLLCKCINHLSKLKNDDSDGGTVIPWLPKECNAYYLFQVKEMLEKLKLPELKVYHL